MKELLGWSLDGALDPWSCFTYFSFGLIDKGEPKSCDVKVKTERKEERTLGEIRLRDKL